jgi:UDP-glucose 4-epimerase
LTNYLVTGGAGFIGSHLTEVLAGRGDDVIVLDDLSTGTRDNLAVVLDAGAATLVEGPTMDERLVAECMENVDVCIHLASAVGVQLIIEEPLRTLLGNVRGADVVISTAAWMNKRILVASSSEIYGKNSQGALHEDADRHLGPPTRSRWAYANAKCFAEFLVNAHVAEQDTDAIVFRLFNTTGPRQLAAYGMVLPRLVRQAIVGEPLTVYGDGRQTRCFLHVSDAVSGILDLALEPGARGRTFNIGSEHEIDIRSLAELVIERAESSSSIEFIPFDEAYGDGFEELGRRRPDTSAIRALTGWSPQRSLGDIVDDAIAYERAAAHGLVR